LREWLHILGLVLAATCGLLVVQVLYDDFRDLRELGARGGVLLEYLLVTMPGFLTIVLPLALLLSLLYTLGKLHRGNELTAMRVAGVGFIRMTMPIWIVGVLCCGVTWWLNTTVVPWSVVRSRAMQEELKFRHQSTTGIARDRVGAIENVGFDNRRVGRMWMFNRYSKAANRGYGVSVSELDAERREVRRITASDAYYEPMRRGWMFENGRELIFAPVTGELLGSKPFETWFAENYHEQPDLMLLIDRKPVDLSLHELRELIDYLEVEHSPKAVNYALRYFGLIANTLSPLIVIAIAIPFSVTGVRINPAVGVSKSIGLFFLYSVLATIANSLAAKGLLEPMMAAWFPNIGMIGLALWLFMRMR